MIPAVVQENCVPESFIMTAMASDGFLARFVGLSVVSGITIGMGKIVTQLLAIDMGATPFQIGIITAMESAGMMLLTVPAGFIIAKRGARFVYFTASLGPLLIYLIMPFLPIWWMLALARGTIGVCIPFRTVSMNSAFLEQLKHIGMAKAGWYRASLIFGMAVLGPASANILTDYMSYTWCFVVVAALFAVMAVFSLSFFPTFHDQVDAQKLGMWSELIQMLRHRDVMESCCIELIAAATGGLFATFIILTAMELPGLTAQDGVNVLLFQGTVVMLTLVAGGKFLSGLRKNIAYGVGATTGVLSLLIIGMAGSFLSLVIGAMLLSFATGCVHVVNVMMLSKLPGDKSKISGLYGLCAMLGGTAGAVIGSVMTKFMTVQFVFLAWIPVLVFAGIAVFLLVRFKTYNSIYTSG